MKWLKGNQTKSFAYNDQHFYRGVYEKADKYDIRFQPIAGRKEGQFDQLLKKFQYKQ